MRIEKIREITLEELNPEKFVEQKIREISSIVDGIAINALSGGVDSSVVTILGNQAIGDRLKTYFIDNGLMRKNEPEMIIKIFKEIGINVNLVDAQDKFFKTLKGKVDPEEKRKAIMKTFYGDVFRKLAKENKAKYLLHGTIYTDIEETVSGIKRQHNILEQIGIDPEKNYGYKIIEPLKELRKPAVREIAKYLGLPKEIYDRKPFPGPALAARVIGEVTPEKIEIVREATEIVENLFSNIDAFQYMAILHEDLVTGIRDGKRKLGYQIEIRCWKSEDAVTANPCEVSYKILKGLSELITSKIPDVVSVTYNITPKPPSTIEAV
ncbi:MAG: ExsB family transcriptional regulator [Candidatus Aenigmatarchaeota archaeon]